MAYAVIQDVASSWDMYRRVHLGLMEPAPNGLILHVAGPTDEGFRPGCASVLNDWNPPWRLSGAHPSPHRCSATYTRDTLSWGSRLRARPAMRKASSDETRCSSEIVADGPQAPDIDHMPVKRMRRARAQPRTRPGRTRPRSDRPHVGRGAGRRAGDPRDAVWLG
jgi:hypothetical protein